MQRIPVESSDIVSIGYDEREQVLEVEFQGGRVYQYRGVEPDVHRHFMRADSHGQYFNSFINNRYKYKKVEAQRAAKQQPKAIAFVTGNARKARDLKLACEPYGVAIEQLELPVDEIQSNDPADIALKKAKHAYSLAGRPVIVQDGFWSILALRGFPGAFMSFVAKWFTAEDFLRLMEGKDERTVIITDTLTYYDGKRHKAFTQNLQGAITHESRGKGLSPTDQIVVLSHQTQTIAEIEDTAGTSSINPLEDALYTPLAKWLHLQHRLGKV
jgi:XTP/dITP diphosphohydrolase